MILSPKNSESLTLIGLDSSESDKEVWVRAAIVGSTQPKLINNSKSAIGGVAIASFIIALWTGSFIFLLGIEIYNPLIIILGIGWQTFLYTGLFITAHDAIHESIDPQHHQVNYFFGSLALLLYGFFSYDELLKTHRQHHHHPATDKDPDFHDGKHKNAVAWYLYFMQGYWSWWRLIALIITYGILYNFLHIHHANLMIFWAVPLLLSSIQLFYFGTFLPHREPVEGYSDSSHTRSIYLPFLWSFLTCYHFGYHQEHHKYPNIPWWKLPAIAKVAMQQTF